MMNLSGSEVQILQMYSYVFVGCQTIQGLEPAGEIISGHEIGEMRAQLIVTVVMETLDGGLLDGAVHPLDLTIGPGMIGLRQSVLDSVRLADHVEAHLPGIDRVSIPGLVGELDPVVGKDRMDPVWHNPEQVFQELPCCSPIGFFNELGNGELAGPVDGHEEIELALSGLHLGNVDVKETDRVALEPLAPRLVPLDIGQARDAMAL